MFFLTYGTLFQSLCYSYVAIISSTMQIILFHCSTAEYIYNLYLHYIQKSDEYPEMFGNYLEKNFDFPLAITLTTKNFKKQLSGLIKYKWEAPKIESSKRSTDNKKVNHL